MRVLAPSHMDKSNQVALARQMFHEGRFPKGGLKAACEACGCSYKTARRAEKEKRPLEQSVRKTGPKNILPVDLPVEEHPATPHGLQFS